MMEQLDPLDAMKDEDIDFSDIPEILGWSGAEVASSTVPSRSR
jgi:hypothetical protein